MNNERIVSIGTNSMIYHKPGCRYVERIKYKNRMAMPKSDARSMQGMRLRLRERDRTEELIIYSECLRDRMKDTDSYHIVRRLKWQIQD